MRLTHMRFPVRRMMVVVAVAALAMFGIVKPLWDRARWSRIAHYHWRQANIDLSRAKSVSESDPDASEKLLVRSKWHESMAARYARSAAYPGMPEPKESAPPWTIKFGIELTRTVGTHGRGTQDWSAEDGSRSARRLAGIRRGHCPRRERLTVVSGVAYKYSTCP
jgi:hypothetical protein